MGDIHTYLPCCMKYGQCNWHYPPGIYPSCARGIGESPILTLGLPKPRSGTAEKLSAVRSMIYRKASAPDTTENAIMNGKILWLPVELLQKIEGCLPLCSAAAFAFSNRHICNAIGQQSWIELRKPENKREKLVFLTLLGKDQQDSWLCENCGMLHFNDFDRGLFCKGDDTYTYPFQYHLSSSLVQLAIERQQKGPPYGICPDRLSCAGVFRKPGHLRFEYAYRVRVVEGELIIRMDTRIIYEKGGNGLKPLPIFPPTCLHYIPYGCDKMGPSWFHKIYSLAEGYYHCKADYPYVPQDKEDGSTDPDRHLLNRLFSGWLFPSQVPSFACEYCSCIRRHVSNGENWETTTECVVRSYQNVGSGCEGDEKWIGTISQQESGMRLRELRDADVESQKRFEFGPPVRSFRGCRFPIYSLNLMQS